MRAAAAIESVGIIQVLLLSAVARGYYVSKVTGYRHRRNAVMVPPRPSSAGIHLAT